MLPELVSSQPPAVSPKISLLLLPKAVRTLPVSLFPSLTPPPLQVFSWLIRCALCFGVISTIVLVLWFSGLNPAPDDPYKSLTATRLIPTSPALSRAALRHRLPTLFHHPRCRIALLCLLKSFPSLLRGVSVQSKHKWHQGWPRSTLLLYLPSSLRASFPWHPEPERWQSPALVTRFPVLQIPLLQNKISDTFLKYRYSKLWPLFLPYLPNQ